MSLTRKASSRKSKTCSREPSAAELEQLAKIPSAAPFLHNRILILQRGQELASFLVWRSVSPDEFEILQVETLSQFRREGLARKLLRLFLLQIRGNVFLEVRESNAAARKLYESEGFMEIGRRGQYYTDPSEDAIVLKFCSC
jgi:ribosomal-protein-alanine N-acetyltransferase